jgi:hypothetical protein
MSQRAMIVFGVLALLLAFSYGWEALTTGGLRPWLTVAFWCVFAGYLLSAPLRLAHRDRDRP